MDLSKLLARIEAAVADPALAGQIGKEIADIKQLVIDAEAIVAGVEALKAKHVALGV